MRLTLFSILAALLLVTATARRGAKDPPPPVARKNILVPQWGFPYGWGLGPEVGIEGHEDKEKETKEVKRVVNKRKRKDAPAPVPEKKTGWFQSTEHHYVDEVEEVLDGLE